jgi:hypothetical protein
MGVLQIQPAAEFQALPLEFIIAAPLSGAIKAQALAAQTTLQYIKGMMKEDPTTKIITPMTVNFTADIQTSGDSMGTKKTMNINVPFMSIVPIPHIRIDSLTVNFKYEISQTVKSTDAKDEEFGLQAGTSGLLSNWISASLKGSVSNKSSEESTMNRSGTLEITVHASEAPIPEGLAKLLNLLSNAITAEPK